MKNITYRLWSLEKDVFNLSIWAKRLSKLWANIEDIKLLYNSLRKTFIELSEAITYIEQNEFTWKFDFYWFQETFYDNLVSLKSQVSLKYHRYFCFYDDWKEIPWVRIVHNV